MDKSLITVTSPLLPDLDDFHAMLKEILGEQVDNKQRFFS